MLFGFQPAQAVRVPFAALGGTAAVPPSEATGSLQDLVSPNTEDTRREGAEEEQKLAPLEVGGAVASGDAAAAAPAGDEGGEVERVEDAVVPPPAPHPAPLRGPSARRTRRRTSLTGAGARSVFEGGRTILNTGAGLQELRRSTGCQRSTWTTPSCAGPTPRSWPSWWSSRRSPAAPCRPGSSPARGWATRLLPSACCEAFGPWGSGHPVS